jgi:hypothetical protein
MNVKCPYCCCTYKIDTDSLPKPIGDTKLGYGWWFRCCRCHKKWWLKNLTVQAHTNTPIKADIANKINRLSRLKKRQEKNQMRTKTWRFIKYILFFILVGSITFGIYNREFFKEFINQKLERLSANIVYKLRMLDVQYSLRIDENNNLIVTIVGKIINDDKNVIRLNGIKVTVYDQNNQEINSWTDNIGTGYIIAGETLDFTTERPINKPEGNIRVDVSVM